MNDTQSTDPNQLALSFLDPPSDSSYVPSTLVLQCQYHGLPPHLQTRTDISTFK